MKTEIRKKTMHILMGVGFVYLIAYNLLNIWVLFLILALTLLILWLRRHSRSWDRVLTQFDRKDKRGGIGAMWFVLGVLLVWLVFHEHPRIVAAAIMILTFGDAASSIVGRRYGENPNPLDQHKYIEGTAAGVFVAFLAAWFFVHWITAFIGALAAMLVEAADFRYKFYNVDDNLIMPLIAALAMYPLRGL